MQASPFTCLMIVINTLCCVNGHYERRSEARMISTHTDTHIHRCANGSEVKDECSCEEMETLCKRQPCLTKNEHVMRRHLCDGAFDCSDLSDECLCDRRTLENANTYDTCSNIFKGLSDNANSSCSKGTISCGTNNDDYDCIKLNQVCDGNEDCPNGWDEKFCRLPGHHHGQYKTFYSCKERKMVDVASVNITGETHYENGEWKLIDWRRTFDGKADCSDISDEWHENFVYCGNDKTSLEITRCQGSDGEILFASPSNAVESLAFPIMEWFFGIFGVIGNSLVAINSIVAITKRQQVRPRHSLADADVTSSSNAISSPVGGGKIINHILVLFLCTSDWLMSVQILFMASANEYFRGTYWQHDEDWLSSGACSVVGSLAIFSTQASAFMIVVISYVRLYAVSKPFKHLRVRCVVIACFSTYALAAILMSIPLSLYITPFDLYFTTSARVQNPPQSDANVLERDKIESYVSKIVLLTEEAPNIDFTRHGWEDLERVVVSINPEFGNWLYFRYYSLISVCLPPIVSHWSDPGLLYSFCLLVIDFCAFLLVFIAYYVVFRTTRRGRDSCIMAVGCCAKNRPLSRHEVELNSNEEIPTRLSRTRSMTRDEEDYEMQKRILWIIGTDCVCWAPVFFMTLACMINNDIKGTTTFLLAMFAIQINCVVNPLVYSRRVRKAVRHAVKKCVSKLRCILSCKCDRNATPQDQAQEPGVSVSDFPSQMPLETIDTDAEEKSTSTETLEADESELRRAL